MPWGRIDDGYFRHSKVLALSKDAKLLDLAGIVFSARELRDGILSRHDVLIVAAEIAAEDVWSAVDELVRAGRWRRGDDGTLIIHDYLTYHPTREKVLKEREEARRRMERLRGRDAPLDLGAADVRPEHTPNFGRSSAEVPRPRSQYPEDDEQPRVRARESSEVARLQGAIIPHPVLLRQAVEPTETAEDDAPTLAKVEEARAFALMAAYYLAAAIPVQALTKSLRRRELRIAHDLCEAGATPDEARACVQWQKADRFRGIPRSMRDYERHRTTFLAGRDGGADPEAAYLARGEELARMEAL